MHDRYETKKNVGPNSCSPPHVTAVFLIVTAGRLCSKNPEPLTFKEIGKAA